MARANKSKAIGNHTYEVTQLGAIEGRRVFARLAQLMGGMVGSIAAGGKADVVKGFQAFAESMTPEVMDFFCDTFSKVTQVHVGGGKVLFLKDIFDDHFADNYGDMVEWLTFCLEVNFASFLGGAGGLSALFQRGTGTSES
jgi:hypothetical protein